MIQENKYLLLTIVIFLSLTSCQNTKNIESLSQKVTFSISEENELFVNYADGTKQMLSSEGIGYKTRISPDYNYLTVDIAKFSNLQITKLFERTKNGEFLETENLSSTAWKIYCVDNNIKIEDISNPRSRVVRLSNNEVVLELSGMYLNQKNIFEGLKIKLR